MITVETNSPRILLENMRNAIDQGRISSWMYDDEHDFTLFRLGMFCVLGSIHSLYDFVAKNYTRHDLQRIRNFGKMSIDWMLEELNTKAGVEIE